MRRGILYILVFLILLALPFVVRRLQYYGLNSSGRESPPAYSPVNVTDLVPTPAANEFIDEPEVGSGLILLDDAHNNDFELTEIGFLDSREKQVYLLVLIQIPQKPLLLQRHLDFQYFLRYQQEFVYPHVGAQSKGVECLLGFAS